MNVFLDTSVLLDVLARREPFYSDSAEVWTLAERGQVRGFISTLSIANLSYLLRREASPKAARKALSVLQDIFGLVPLDARIIDHAIDSAMDDFEDAIQFFSAIRAGADILITRNGDDFPDADMAIQTPAEFLATHFPR